MRGGTGLAPSRPWARASFLQNTANRAAARPDQSLTWLRASADRRDAQRVLEGVPPAPVVISDRMFDGDAIFPSHGVSPHPRGTVGPPTAGPGVRALVTVPAGRNREDQAR